MRECRPLARLLPCALSALACIAAGPAPAQDGDDQDGDLGGARVAAGLRTVGYFSDNFYNQPADTTSGYGTLINPVLGILKQSPKLELRGGIEAEYGMFDLPGSQDDYLDGSAQLRFATQATLRNQFRLEGEYKHGHDPFGADRTEDATVRDEDLDEWNRAAGAFHYRYGAPGARLNAELGVGSLSKSYTTNREATEPLSYESTTFDYTLFYNYSAKTAALIDFSRSDFSFDRPLGVVDGRGGELYRARFGMKWLATGKTSGDVRVGYRQRSFDAGTPDISGVDWEAGIDWAPVPRTMIRVETARSEQESYTVDARVIDIRSARVDGKHNLSSRLRASALLEYMQARFDRADPATGSTRKDDILTFGIGAEYRLLSKAWAVGNLSTTSRDSSLATREYDRLNAFVGVRLGTP